MMSNRHSSGTDEIRQNETTEIVEQLRECGDEAERARLRERLVVVNVPVATSIALRYRSRGEAGEDPVPAAHPRPRKTGHRFDPPRGRALPPHPVPTDSR